VTAPNSPSVLPRQAWVPRGASVEAGPTEFGFVPPEGRRAGNKPVRGGFWTSTWHTDYGCDWIREAGPDGMGLVSLPCSVYLLDPRPARVLVIDALDDLVRALDSYAAREQPEYAPAFGRLFDFERLAADYDAVHLTEVGQWRTRLSTPDNLYGWDCECTLWLRWCFEVVEHLEAFTGAVQAVAS
jgi:hypothetical protein